MNDWTLVLPVKRWTLAKSRLSASEEDRVHLARAFSFDVLDAVLGAESAGRIVVVTAEPELALRAQGHGVTVLSDRPKVDRGQLNQAIVDARQWALACAPDVPIAVVPADLASLTPAALDGALEILAAEERSYVPDESGHGTTLLAARNPGLLQPSYGPQSARLHSAEGCVALMQVDRRCRLDIDTSSDLAAARPLGLGQHTRLALEKIDERREVRHAG